MFIGSKDYLLIDDSGGVRISIPDRVMDLPEKVYSLIFDLFFTIKPVGKGSGLKLSICYEIIVNKHSGKIIHNSTPGNRTKFIIEIPFMPTSYLYASKEKTTA